MIEGDKVPYEFDVAWETFRASSLLLSKSWTGVTSHLPIVEKTLTSAKNIFQALPRHSQLWVPPHYDQTPSFFTPAPEGGESLLRATLGRKSMGLSDWEATT